MGCIHLDDVIWLELLPCIKNRKYLIEYEFHDCHHSAHTITYIGVHPALCFDERQVSTKLFEDMRNMYLGFENND